MSPVDNGLPASFGHTIRATSPSPGAPLRRDHRVAPAAEFSIRVGKLAFLGRATYQGQTRGL
jgi:hypothetical protein